MARMSIHSPLDRKTWFEGAQRAPDDGWLHGSVMRASLLQIAEGWALLAHLRAAEHKDLQTA